MLTEHYFGVSSEGCIKQTDTDKLTIWTPGARGGGWRTASRLAGVVVLLSPLAYQFIIISTALKEVSIVVRRSRDVRVRVNNAP